MVYDPRGFLKHDRVDTPKRPPAERVRDWQPIYLRARDEVVTRQRECHLGVRRARAVRQRAQSSHAHAFCLGHWAQAPVAQRQRQTP